MAFWCSTVNAWAFNNGAGWLSNLTTKGANRSPYTGFPGYSKRSDRATVLPAAVPYSMSIYNSCVFQLFSAGLAWSGSRHGSQNGWYAPDITRSVSSQTSQAVSGAHVVLTMGGASCKVTGLYSGGTVDQYGNSTRNATLERIRLEGISGTYCAIVSAGAVTNANILGTYNPSFIAPGGYMDVTGTTMVYMVGTNR